MAIDVVFEMEALNEVRSEKVFIVAAVTGDVTIVAQEMAEATTNHASLRAQRSPMTHSPAADEAMSILIAMLADTCLSLARITQDSRQHRP